MSPYIANIGLTPIERAKLFAAGVLGMRDDVRPLTRHDIYAEKIGRNNYGRTKKVAARYLEGEFGKASIYEVAVSQGVSPESLKSQIWKVRTGYIAKPRRRTA